MSDVQPSPPEPQPREEKPAAPAGGGGGLSDPLASGGGGTPGGKKPTVSTKMAEPSLDMLGGADWGWGPFSAHAHAGAAGSFEATPMGPLSWDTKDGFSGGPSLAAKGQFGAEAQARVGTAGSIFSSPETGSLTGNISLQSRAYAGGDGELNANLNDGLKASGNLGLGVEAARLQAGLQYEMPEMIGPEAVLAANGDASLEAKAGVGGELALGREGVKGSFDANAFAGARASGDVSAEWFGFKVKASGDAVAGAGAWANGEAGYDHEKGTFKLEGGAGAALGLGAGGKLGVEWNPGQTVEGVKELGRDAYDAADVDNDNRLTLNDPATHVANRVDSAVSSAERTSDAAFNLLDQTGDGRINRGDLTHAANRVRDGVSSTIESGVEGATQLARAGHDVLDRDGDGSLGVGDVTRGASQLKDAAVRTGERAWEKGGELANAAWDKGTAIADRAVDTAARARDWAVDQGAAVYQRGVEAKDRAVEIAGDVADRAHDTLDVDNDGQLGLSDARAAVDKARDEVGRKVEQIGNAAHGALDRDGDGALGLDDVAAGAGQARDAVVDTATGAYNSGREMVGRAADTAGEIVQEGRRRVGQAAQAAHGAMDRDGDGSLGLNDVAAGAGQARDAVVDTAGQVRDTVVESAGQARDWAVEKGGQAIDTGRRLASAAKKEVTEAASRAHSALDRDGDGSLGISDAARGASEAYRHGRRAVANTATSLMNEGSRQLSSARKTLVGSYRNTSRRIGGMFSKWRRGLFGG